MSPLEIVTKWIYDTSIYFYKPSESIISESNKKIYALGDVCVHVLWYLLNWILLRKHYLFLSFKYDHCFRFASIFWLGSGSIRWVERL